MATVSHSTPSYSIGWIAPLYFELAAAIKMLDEEHDEPEDFERNDSDNNSYTWGRIGKHNVVIASLPEYGTSAAATSAAHMRASLPDVKVGLLVGIGAGITGEARDEKGVVTVRRDMFLGDVAVSIPSDANGGVVQHDVKKAKTVDGQKVYQRNGFLDAPPRALRSAVVAVRARHQIGRSKVEEYLRAFLDEEVEEGMFSYPGAEKDPLREVMKAQAEEVAAQKPQRNSIRDKHKIHYGTIVSGNELIKSTEERDSIVDWLRDDNVDPICLEMEAGGLMNNFPCLVVRGISDYGDERKNDDWQGYAAATAAAYAKDLLQYLAPKEVKAAKGIGELMKEVRDDVDHVKARANSIYDHTSAMAARQTADDEREMLDFLTTDDHSDALNASLSHHLEHTDEWFFESPEFSSWLSGEEAHILQCVGEPGAGKTVLAGQAVRWLQRRSNEDEAVLYLFCRHSEQKAQTFDKLISTLLRQICRRFTQLLPIPTPMYQQAKQAQVRPSANDIDNALRACVAQVKRTYLVIDALDECQPSCCQRLLELAKGLPWRYITTSRKDSAISASIESSLYLHIRATEHDLQSYIESEMYKLRARVMTDMELEHKILHAVLNAAGGL
ncbi:hypothetical protein PRZ48_009071 [Zasmidium cellare]|uniref:Nephrocystin 3-like N-terminal domain-containing protein n=1 Tax=Zasmidium cellare TaxID=395010 RepID=A0ABR0EHN6_ZASCE|nr:hypothetical protein PRZ48_009071 [Zasmidium cellare]